MLEFLLTLACSAALGFVLWKVHVPGGMMIGAIIAAAALNITTDLASMPYAAKLAAQTIAGSFIGVSISRDDLRHLPRLIRPLAVLLGCYMAVCLGHRFYHLARLFPGSDDGLDVLCPGRHERCSHHRGRHGGRRPQSRRAALCAHGSGHLSFPIPDPRH